MTNIASVLKSEISRIARKEVRAEIESLKKANLHYRSAIAQLRRELADVHKQLKQQDRQAARQSRMAIATTPGADDAAGPADGTARRFSASRLAAHRAKVGLSAAAYGALVGMSGATIFHWEQGKSRPNTEQLQRLAALRALSKSEITELGTKGPAPAAPGVSPVAVKTTASRRATKSPRAAAGARSAKPPRAAGRGKAAGRSKK
ncbi:MAG: helix-turn-helix domain-containing protein [Proteobacteria bacterium]|nr:helix-turn-helix domain-containing protein [Pseudomonadota bacterium]